MREIFALQGIGASEQLITGRPLISSPAAATIKDLKSRDFRSFLSFLAGKSRVQNLGQTSDPGFDPFW